MSNSTGIKILASLVGGVGAILIFPPLLLFGGPLFLSTGPSFLYGYKTADRGWKRIAKTAVIGLVTGALFLPSISWICTLDGGPLCENDPLSYIRFGLVGIVVATVVMYIGVAMRAMFKDAV